MRIYDDKHLKLAEVFDTRTASYKFYWFLAILDSIKSGELDRDISFNELVARMVSKAWAPLNSGSFSFGSCDALIKRVSGLIFSSELCYTDVEDRVRTFVIQHALQPQVQDVVKKMTVYVPYRFLYPWVGTLTPAQTTRASQDYETYGCPYAIKGKHIHIHPQWQDYLFDHIAILEDFTRMQLTMHLMKFNDNIILPEEGMTSATADGQTYAPYAHLGLVSEAPASEPKDQLIEKLKGQVKTLKTMVRQYQSVQQTISSTQPSTFINNGIVTGSVENLQQNHLHMDKPDSQQ